MTAWQSETEPLSRRELVKCLCSGENLIMLTDAEHESGVPVCQQTARFVPDQINVCTILKMADYAHVGVCD